MRRYGTLGAAAVLLAGCLAQGEGAGPVSTAEPPQAVASAAETASPGGPAPARWYAALIAGNTQHPVFDNFVDDFGADLSRQGIPLIRRYARPGDGRDQAEVDPRQQPLDAGCLYYLTSHGSPEGFVAFERERDGALTARELAADVDRVCGTRPAAVVISACFAEAMLSPALARDNRLILMAARKDRSSFGCSFTRRLNYFDGCFQRHWSNAADWRGLFARVSLCIEELERGEQTPSLPQFAEGSRVTGLRLPGR